MTAVLVSVAEAIREELASLTLSEDVTLERSYADWDDLLADFTKMRLDVVPASCPTDHFSRSKLQYTCTVNALLRRKIGDDDYDSGRVKTSVVDALVEDLQTIHEYFAPSQPSQNGRRLTSVPSARWLPASGIKAPYSRKMLRDHAQFSGWVSLVYGVPRSFGT